jgi:site-specific recombinase XerD
MLGLYKRGRVYYVRGTHAGRKFKTRSLDTTSREVATQRLHQLEKNLDSPHTRGTWSELLELFFSSVNSLKPKTAAKYSFVGQRFAAFLERRAIVKLAEITPAIIAEYIADRSTDTHPTRQDPIGNEGIKSDLRCLRRLFNFAIANEFISRSPIRQRNLNSGVSSSVPFSPEEVQRMLQHARDRAAQPQRGAPIDLYPILLTFLRTGLRISDIIRFPKSAINPSAGQIILTTQKRGKVVYIPLTADLKAALDRRTLTPTQQHSPWLFSTATGKPIANLDAYLRRFWKQAGIQGAHTHRFRDTFAVELLEHGASLYDVAKILGITHAVAERHYTPYVKSLQERARNIMQTLPDLLKEV